MRQRRTELERLAIDVVVVTFESRDRAEEYVRESALPWPLLIDRRRALYHAYEMGRGSWSAIWGPASWWAYARLIARGRRPGRPTDDVRQLGGDVLVDPAGSVVLHHVGQGPADRPTVSAIIERVERG